MSPPRPRAPSHPLQPNRLAELAAPALVLLAIAFAAFVRWRLADVPLQRDEGEYAYAGQLILRGIPPYALAYNMKFPGTYYAYALVMAVLGQTARGIHLGLLLVNAATTWLVWRVGRRLCGRFAGALAAAAFALLSLDRWLQGPFAHATHFVLLPALAALALLLRPPGPRRALVVLASGVLLGLAVLVKQHAFTFLPLGAAVIAWGTPGAAGLRARHTWLDIARLAAGALLPFVLLCAVLAAQGVLAKFAYWTFGYASAYVSEVPLADFGVNLAGGFRGAAHAAWPLWLAAAAGLAALWLTPWPRATRLVATALLVAAFVAVCPGLYFREHYFILMLPAVALLAGVAFATARRALARALPAAGATALAAAAFAALLAGVVLPERAFLFAMTPRQLSRSLYGADPFIEAVEIGRYLRAHTTDADRIAVLGSEPEIGFYAGRRLASGYLYMYPLMEPQPYAARMQDDMIRELEAARPRYAVFVPVASSWWVRPGSERRLLDWQNRWLNERYTLAGIADIRSEETTRYVWDADVQGYQPNAATAVFVFRRRDTAAGDGGR